MDSHVRTESEPLPCLVLVFGSRIERVELPRQMKESEGLKNEEYCGKNEIFHVQPTIKLMAGCFLFMETPNLSRSAHLPFDERVYQSIALVLRITRIIKM